MYNPQLETFLHVADAGSFNKAATESFITPTAVIKQINLLEENLGVSLFERTHRGLILTEAGKSLYQDAKYIIQYCKDSVTRARNAVKTENELNRIGTSPMTPASVLLELWPKIHERCSLCCFHSSSAGSKDTADIGGSVWAEPVFDAPELESLCR